MIKKLVNVLLVFIYQKKTKPIFSKDNKYIIIAILLFFLAFFFYFDQYKKIPIRYWDEHDWIAKSYFFDLVLQRKFGSFLWLDVNSYNHPKLGEYLYGVALYPAYLNYKKNLDKKEYGYIHFLIDHNFYIVHSSQYEKYKNRINFIEWGKKPWEVMDVSPDYLIKKFGRGIEKTINLIYTARTVNVFILTLNVLVVYFLSFVLSSSVLVAFLTSLFFGANTLIVSASLRAQSDGLFLFLFNLCLLFLVLFFKNKKYSFNLGFLFFFFAALLNATKINGVMLVFIFDFIAFLILVYRWIFKDRVEFQIFKTLIFGNFLFLLVFICHHPLLIRHPIQGTISLYKHRQEVALHQAIYEMPQTALWDFKRRILAICDNFFSKEGVVNYNNYYPFRSIIAKHSIVFSRLFLTSFIVGLIIFIKMNGKKYWYFLVTFTLVIIIMGFYLLLNWDRYFIFLNYYLIFFSLNSLARFINECLSKYLTSNYCLKLSKKSKSL